MTRLTLLAVLAFGCQKNTEVLVVLTSDLTVPDEADGVSVSVTLPNDGGRMVLARDYQLPSEATLPASLDLVDAEGTAPTVAVDVQLTHAGMLVVERKALFPFARDQSLELRLDLSRNCSGIPCSADLTCVAGECVSPAIDPSQLTSIDPDPLAPAPASCPPASAPTPTAGCTVYDFTAGRVPDGLSMISPPDVTITYECGMMRARTPAGDHDVTGTAIERVQLSAPATTAPFRVTARFHASFMIFDDYGGVGGFVSPTEWVVLEAEARGPENDAVFWSGSIQSAALVNRPLRTTMESTLTRTAVDASGSHYDASTLEGPVATGIVLPLAAAQQPTFYTGNHGPATDVYLEWMMVCPP
jgi:hypothetical protein